MYQQLTNKVFKIVVVFDNELEMVIHNMKT